jgi:hypothetical protein
MEMRLHHEALLDRHEELSRVGTEAVSEMRDRTNTIFQNVTHNRERLIDAITIKELASVVNQQVCTCAHECVFWVNTCPTPD